jgi:hypothetical protein
LKLTKKNSDDSDYSNCGHLIGKYFFYEDSTQQHSGFFSGIMDCDVYIDINAHQVGVDQTLSGSDFYKNRTFVGIWTSYTTKLSKTCIWGDDRLPYSYGFAKGDGVMKIAEKYAGNGWKSFNDGSEYIRNRHGEWELKDKWWIAK